MAHPTTNRVGAVCFDAMHTALETVLSRTEFEAKIFADVSGITTTVDPEEFMSRMTTLKREHPRSGKDMGQYWPPLNRLLLEHYGATGDLDAKARAMHDRHYDDASLYTVHDDMRELLEWVTTQAIVVA
ncbi:MAG: hypothetical protein Q7S02_06120, partial [bacterium]|nr:hypothetical protein [bacterium]